MIYKNEDYLFFYKENKFTSDIFDDLLKETFDVTWHRNLPNNDPARVFSIIDPELQSGAVDDKTITYQYNEDFFRCDSFKKNHDGKHILFSGCSETEGVGGNIEDAWSHILYNKIAKKEKCSGFFNLAKSGWGWSRIIINALIYFKKYGYPDTYFILLPNHQRKFYYQEKLNGIAENTKWVYYQTYPSYYAHKNNKLEKLSDPKEYFEDFVFFLINWKTFLELCKSNNVKLIFSTWDPQDSINLNNGIFNEFLLLEKEKVGEYVNEYYKTNIERKDDIKKRDGHAGRVIHHFFAEKFYEQYEQRGYNV